MIKFLKKCDNLNQNLIQNLNQKTSSVIRDSNSEKFQEEIYTIGFFSKWSRTFIEIREFRESEKSLRHELGSV